MRDGDPLGGRWNHARCTVEKRSFSGAILTWAPKLSGAKRIPLRINLNGASPGMTKGFV